MDHFEMVEKLRKEANVTYEEARAALESSDWDLLDAMVVLESKGKIRQDGETYSTRKQPVNRSEEKEATAGFFRRIGRALIHAVNALGKISVEVRKGKQTIVSLPALVVIFLALIRLSLVLVPFVVCLVFGFRFAITGVDAGNKSVDNINRMMDKAADTMQYRDENGNSVE